ncbi:MAG: MerR family DNA-binding protein [Nannocystaceae bacterium]
MARLQFIARAKLLGFTLSETRELLDLRRVAVDCGDVRSRAQAKILQVRQKIAELHRIEGALLRLADACPGVGELDNCPILAALEQDDGDAS